ncbi:MAG TPA: BamA/TamA family outer membrane protein [Bryobacteraceae bacterium]|nr:BamA/TamA family outer membrane protein [Bryobacteraceae bacterium]
MTGWAIQLLDFVARSRMAHQRLWYQFAPVVLSLACAVPLAAQTGRFEGRTIAEIQYEPALTIDPVDLERFQPLKKGTALHADDVARAIDALYSTGRFTDISVEAEPAGDGVIVRFVTESKWFVGGVNVEGKIGTAPSRGQLHSSAQFTLGTEFRDEDVSSAVDNLKRLLTANGLYEGSVTPEVERNANGQQVFITFHIHEGKRAKYDMPVIQGNTLFSEDAIIRATGWRIPLIHWWLKASQARTRKGVSGVRSKYEGKGHLAVRARLESIDYDADHRRMHPHLTIDPGPKIEVQAVEAKVSKRVLKRYVPVYDERAVDTDLLVEGRRNLEDYFQSKGYYDVEVDFRVRPPQNDLETIEYAISKGERHKVARVEIAGNKYFDTPTIRERMFITPASFNIRHGRYSDAFRKKDEENIAELYKSNGFRDVKVATRVDDDYKGKSGDVSVTVTVTEGPQWIVDKLEVAGMAQIQRQDLPVLASSVGQPFADVNLAADRNAILTYYFAHGLPSATFKAAWQPGEEPNHVNVRYEITEGERQYVRRVITSGIRTTRQSLVDKTITMKPGDALSPVTQTDIQKRLYDLGVFARVDTAIQNPDGAAEHKYVLYNFEEANRYTLNIGVGAQVARFGTPSTTTLAAPGGETGFSPEFSFDISRINFLGRGHTLSLKTLYSSLEKRASFSYLQPRFLNDDKRTITYSLLYDRVLNVRTFSSLREEGSVQVSQTYSKSLTELFRFAYRRVSVSDVVIPVLLIPQFLQSVRIGMLSTSLIQDRRNNPANPSRGIYNTVDVGLADKVFGSQRNFARVLGRNATYYRVTKQIIFARQTQFGIILPFNAPAGLTAQESVPLPERFFGGGADSLRAFPYNQAGPRDIGAPLVPGGPSSPPTGFPLGGNALLFNNLELRFPLIGENVQGVLFHDMGNIFTSISNISFRYSQKDLQDFDYTVHAVGFGIRYQTPVGPIRVDLAYTLNPPAYNGFGGTPTELLQCNPNLPPSAQPSFCTPTRQSIGHFQFFFSIGQAF